ncbi:MAG: hypothetical protein P8M25_08805 [Paracoccaceae bacterium]|nr:hypothetical protein [Paracoccaceae bacterium]
MQTKVGSNGNSDEPIPSFPLLDYIQMIILTNHLEAELMVATANNTPG